MTFFLQMFICYILFQYWTVKTAEAMQVEEFKCKVVNIFKWICYRELSFKKGDTVYILRKIDQNWYEGEHHGRVGIFPISYVEVCSSF